MAGSAVDFNNANVYSWRLLKTTEGVTPPFSASATIPATMFVEVSLPSAADLSGTHILSDKPIALFGSHACANISSTDEFFWHCAALSGAMNTVSELVLSRGGARDPPSAETKRMKQNGERDKR